MNDILRPILLFGLLVPCALPAQERRERQSVRFDPFVSTVVEFDNNVFLLSSSRRDALENQTDADRVSGRFTNMESAADLVARLAAGVGIHPRGSGLTVRPRIEYDYYVRNAERRHFTLDLGVDKDLPRGASLRADVTYTPSYFAKNYLSDATDANGDRLISATERRYARGEYSDLDFDAGAKFRVRAFPRGRANVKAGYYTRSYDAPFESRDVAGPTVGLSLEFGRRVNLEIAYDGEFLSGDPAPEVMIVDEADVGRDLNANGTATDAGVRTVQTADRSRNEHELGVGATFDLPGGADFRVGYGFRMRDFTSNEEFDVTHRGRSDKRHDLRGEYSRRVTRGVRFLAGARYARQSTNREGDADRAGEFEDYSRVRGHAGLRVEF